MSTMTTATYVHAAIVSVLTGLSAGLATLALGQSYRDAVIIGASASVTTALSFLTGAPIANRALVNSTLNAADAAYNPIPAASLGQTNLNNPK